MIEGLLMAVALSGSPVLESRLFIATGADRSRRALALGADDQATLGLYRTVEFLLEDMTFKLP